MDADIRATLEARLRDAGMQPTLPLDLGATIRTEPSATTETIPADPSAAARPSTLPRLSIDLGGAPRAAAAPDGADLEIVGVIGEGGMGRVLLARQRSLRREVAIKTTRPEAPPEAARSILVEGATAGRLEHPAIVPVHVLGLDEAGRPALVMKRIEGVGWDALLREPAHPGWEGWEGDPSDRLPGHLQILAAICNAVHYAHSRGVIHRDIKPENVLIGSFGDVYLADWGIAIERTAESPGRLCGTPGYMAPEMALGRPVDERTDVYLLGATLHEILTGRLRHDAATALGALAMAILSEPHEYDESVPRELAELANRACHASPDERPPSAKAFRDALARYAKHRDSVALAEEASERLGRLEGLLASGARDDGERREADRLAAEARFGLQQALERWPENARARDALDRLDAILDARSRRAAELEREAHETDPRVGVRGRAITLTVFAVAAAAISTTALREARSLSEVELVAIPAFLLVLLLGGVAIMRRSILPNRFSRELTSAVALALVVMTAGRLLGLVREITMAEHFARDGFTLGVAFLVLGITHLRWIGAIGAILFATGVACTLFPEHALVLFGLATAGCTAVAAAVSWRAALRAPPPRDRSAGP